MNTLPNTNASFQQVFSAGGVYEFPDAVHRQLVFGALLRRLEQQGRVDSAHHTKLVQALDRRESYGTSAIGKGLAFPHLRTRHVNEMVGVIGYIAQGCNFDSLDHRPTKCVFLTLSPVQWRCEHGKLLQRLFSMLRDPGLELLLEQSSSADAVWNHVMSVDSLAEARVDAQWIP